MTRPPFPLPNPSKRLYIPPHRKLVVGDKAMTMIAGFRCDSGVVLCADTELTVSGWLKYPGSKLRLYNRLQCQPAFSFAGDVRFCEMTVSKLASCISSAQKENRHVLATVEEEVLRIHRTFAGEPYEEGSALIMSLLEGPEGGKKRTLYGISGGIVTPNTLVCEGTGKLVVQGMLTELFTPGFSIKQAALLALYLLAEAKNYGYGVGKDSQILLLSDRGGWTPFPDDPFYTKAKEIEADYIDLKRWLRPVLLAYSDIGVNEKAFEGILKDLGDHITARRKKRYASYEAFIEWDIEQQAEEAQRIAEEGEK